jgi:molybdopterin synthase sulfur carrier subunit
MNEVHVKYRGHLAVLTGTATETFEARERVFSVDGLLKCIRRRHGKEAEKHARSMLIALNGESILLLRRYRTALKDGDVVSFFPLCAGG